LHLTVRAADCQNFALYAPGRHVAGVVHVGWRGILAGAIGGCIAALQSSFDISPRDVWIVAGPSLCLQCAEYADPEHELRKRIDVQYVRDTHVDLRSAATNQFVIAGVPSRQIEHHPDCTKCHPERYYTYRGGNREEVEAGTSNVLVCTLL
jgi:copper oxidase (laccase) domain-containing protein